MFKKTIQKFKLDLLPKVCYDIMKVLGAWIFTFGILPFWDAYSDLLDVKLSISVWGIIIIIFSCISLAWLITRHYYRIQIGKILQANSIDKGTGVFSQEKMYKDFDALISAKNSDDYPISLILIDIDNFKKYNDDYSYQFGDKVLEKVGAYLSKDIRISDSVYRYHQKGDEFLIIAMKTSPQNGRLAAESKRKGILESSFLIDSDIYNVQVSCGVTEFKKDEALDDVLARLDSALKDAKSQEGKNNTKLLM